MDAPPIADEDLVRRLRRGDLAAFDALDRLETSGALRTAVRVGVASDEGPPEIRARADIVVDGPSGLAALLDQLVT